MQYTPPPSTPPQQITSAQTSASETALSETQRLSDDRLSDPARAALLRAQLNRIIAKNERNKITTSVIVKDVQSGQILESHKPNTVQFAASINKLPIAQLIALDINNGTLSKSKVLSWQSTDVRAGLGVYDQAGAKTSATVEELLYDMLNKSGNTAVRVLVNYALGGAVNTNVRFANELGLKQTALQPLEGNAFYVGNTTADESLNVITKLLQKNDSTTQFIKNAMATNVYTDYGVRNHLAGNNYIVLANKVGILDDPTGNNRHDVGIIYNTQTGKTYAYSIMNTAPGETNYAATTQAGTSISDMGRSILRYSGDKAPAGERALQDVRGFTERRTRF